MTTKVKAVSVIVLLATSFAFGRYSIQQVSVSTNGTIKVNKDTKIDKDTHKVTIITKDPTGKEVTIITEDSKTTTDKIEKSIADKNQTVTPQKRSTLNISALASMNFLNGFVPVYGASVSKEILGPITVGVFALTNSTFGISLGLNF